MKAGHRVMLTGTEYSEERYLEGKVVLPVGAIGSLIEAEMQGDDLFWYVDFGTVTLLVKQENLIRLGLYLS